jgi:hypothetical protein
MPDDVKKPDIRLVPSAPESVFDNMEELRRLPR